MNDGQEVKDNKGVLTPSPASTPSDYTPQPTTVAAEEKKIFIQRVKEPGSVWQIIIAALLAITIGLIVAIQVDEVPEAVTAILTIPGSLWLRALRAVGEFKTACQSGSKTVLMNLVLPMIVTAMIMAIQRLRNMTQGDGKAGKSARWTIGYYVITTIIAVAHSCLLVGLVWSKLVTTVSGEQLAISEDDKAMVEDRQDIAIHEVVVDMFHSLVPQNIVNARAIDSLLTVLITAVVIGYVIKPGGALVRAVEEI